LSPMAMGAPCIHTTPTRLPEHQCNAMLTLQM
jgi:hypothetical protein